MIYLNPATKSSDSYSIERQPALPQSLPLPTPAKFPPPTAKVGLKAKLMLIAIALGVIPVMTIGAISYQVTKNHVTRQINLTQQARTGQLATMLEDYITARRDEVSSFASNTIFTNPNVIDHVTISQKKAALSSFQDQNQFFDHIAYLDLQGSPLFQSQSAFPLVNNLGDRPYFQQAIANKRVVMSEIKTSPLTGEMQMEFAAPVKNAWTDEVIGVMYFRIPSEQIKPVFAQYVTQDEQWHLINTKNIITASSVANSVNKSLENYYPQLQGVHGDKQEAMILGKNPQLSSEEQLVNYVPVKLGATNPQLNLGTAIALDKDVALASLQPLRWIFLGGTIGTALLVSSIAGLLANRLLQPLSTLTTAVENWKQGKLDTKINLKAPKVPDEITILGSQVKEMAKQFNVTVQQQKDLAKTAELISNISLARSPRELQMPLSLFLTKVMSKVSTDRLFFYQFDHQKQGKVVAESVAGDFPRTLGIQFDDPYFSTEEIKKYQGGRIKAMSDIERANLTEAQLQQLKLYQVKASLVLPVILDQPTLAESEQLIGLLVAHQCSRSRVWQQSDIDYLQQIAYQLGVVLTGYCHQRAESNQTIDLKKDVAQVASNIDKMTQGNTSLNSLDLRQENDSAKSLETIVCNVRQALTKVKFPATEINSQLINNQQDLAKLQNNLSLQANQLKSTFLLIEQIVRSMTQVSSQATLASEAVNSVVKNVEIEQTNFVQAVNFMAELKTYLRKNTDKVNHLNSASQKMTRVIDSIRKINLRASLLASKLGSRIPSIGDSTFGLQEEIASIQQSIAATKELESLVRCIDSDISEVLHDYFSSGNILKQEKDIIVSASKNLEQIVKTTKIAQQHLFSLVQTTDTQVKATRNVNKLKGELECTSKSMYYLSDRAAKSLEKTAITANDLKNVVDFFQLDQVDYSNY